MIVWQGSSCNTASKMAKAPKDVENALARAKRLAEKVNPSNPDPKPPPIESLPTLILGEPYAQSIIGESCGLHLHSWRTIDEFNMTFNITSMKSSTLFKLSFTKIKS